MTLLEQVEQFLYTHPVQHHKVELLRLIRDVENQYLKRINELETKLKPSTQKSQVLDPADDFSGCQCANMRFPPCSWCTRDPYDLDNQDGA